MYYIIKLKVKKIQEDKLINESSNERPEIKIRVTLNHVIILIADYRK